MVDLTGLEPTINGLKVRCVTITLQIHLVGTAGVEPATHGASIHRSTS